jgi:hypothetical protein
MAKVEKNQKNIGNCACPLCPSYNECAKGKAETLYCAKEVGKSDCKYQMSGCICGPCPVHKECNLKSGYYCIQGSADEVDDKK